jgi:hypothetical protein
MRTTEDRLTGVEQYIDSSVETTVRLLESNGFIVDGQLSTIGHYAVSLKEVHCLVFAELYASQYFEQKGVGELVKLFSCFTNISVQEQWKDTLVPASMKHIVGLYDAYFQKETGLSINSGVEYEIQYDLMPYMQSWCDSQSVEDCKWVLQQMMTEKGIFLGELVKALLKINNMAAELASIAEKEGNMTMLSTLKSIPDATLKFVATNQSLYV